MSHVESGGPDVRTWKGFELSHFQVQAVRAIRAGHDVLVSAPTGAGKTLIAEYAIEDAVRRGRRCIYTAPIKALSNQKYRDFRDEPDVDVGLMTGDVTIHPTAQVLIMTTEILRNSIFDNPEYLADVEYAVFDEVHFLDDPERGTVWEESLIFAPETMRFICLSATISNHDQLGSWLQEIRGRPVDVIVSDRRPVPLSHNMFTEKSGGFDLRHLEKVRKRELGGKKRASARPRGPRGPRDKGGRDRSERPPGPPDPGPLIDELTDQGRLPALVFAFSRKDCERLARRNARRCLLAPDETARMAALQDELLDLFRLERDEVLERILEMSRGGVAYHHAGLLPTHKELVERMFTSGLLKLLFTTETFALGINMPARSVVFTGLRKFDGVSFDYLRTRDYMQMAGRAGRQGIDSEGLVYSLLGPRDLVEAPLKKLVLGKPEPVYSRFRLAFCTIVHLVERLGRERVYEAWERSFNQFQHRESSKKAEHKNRRTQRRVIDAHLAFLDHLHYLDGDQPTPRGHVLKRINGYEVQLTEMLFRGTLEDLPTDALAMVFVAMIYELRRRGPAPHVPARMYGGIRRHVTGILRSLSLEMLDFGVPTPLKLPDWTLTPAVLAWVRGATLDEVGELVDATPGDICRTFRMAIQLMRQVRRAIDPGWDLRERLEEAMAVVNRGEIDARRQLELG